VTVGCQVLVKIHLSPALSKRRGSSKVPKKVWIKYRGSGLLLPVYSTGGHPQGMPLQKRGIAKKSAEPI